MSEIVTQTKLILPGSQIKYNNLVDANDKYFVYCSTYSVFVFNKSDFKLRSILGEKSDKIISAIALNYSTSEELLSLYYNQEILIYNLYTNKYSYSIPFTGLKKMKFNRNSNLIILNDKGELYISKVDYNGIQYINKIRIDEGGCNCFKWYPFNSNDFVHGSFLFPICTLIFLVMEIVYLFGLTVLSHSIIIKTLTGRNDRGELPCFLRLES